MTIHISGLFTSLTDLEICTLAHLVGVQLEAQR
jgi:hypothetical protein